jgi:hypothetical protein
MELGGFLSGVGAELGTELKFEAENLPEWGVYTKA